MGKDRTNGGDKELSLNFALLLRRTSLPDGRAQQFIRSENQGISDPEVILWVECWLEKVKETIKQNIKVDKIKSQKPYFENDKISIFKEDILKIIAIPENSIDLIITSPPYNIGKEYEKKLRLGNYLEQQAAVIRECVRCLSPRGSICWQVGNYVDRGAIVPLDMVLYPIFESLGLKMRNRIIWHFEHGLHCAKRFSGRYETIVWFTIITFWGSPIM